MWELIYEPRRSLYEVIHEGVFSDISDRKYLMSRLWKYGQHMMCEHRGFRIDANYSWSLHVTGVEPSTSSAAGYACQGGVRKAVEAWRFHTQRRQQQP